MDREKVKGIFITVIGAACWGISGCFGQYLFTEKNIDAAWLVTVRLIIAGLILIIIGFISDRKKMMIIFKDKRDFKSLLYFSFFGMLLCQLAYFLAIEYSNVGTATVLQALSSIIILFYICFKESRMPKRIELFVLFLAIIGVFLLATGGNITTMSLSFLALFFGLLAAIGGVTYNILSINIMRKYGVYVTVGFGMLFAGLFLMFITKPWSYNIIFDTGTVIGLVGVIIIGTVIAFSFFLKGVSIVGSFMGGLLGNVEPIMALIISVLFLGVLFSFIEFIGVIFILSTVLILSFNRT